MAAIILPSEISRRKFVKNAAIASFLSTATSLAQLANGEEGGRTFAYVGTYTGAAGAGSNGEGIYRFAVNDVTGELSGRKLVAQTPNPSWIAIHPSGRSLYAVNEVADFHGHSGSVSTFTIDPSSYDLHPLNTVSSEGAGPAHMSIDTSGRFALVANYGDGSIAVLPILPGGALGTAVDLRRDHDSVGAQRAPEAPPGSFAISGHDAPHAHMILADPQNRFVLATDLGQDRIYVYSFDAQTGKLTPSSPAPFVALPSGDGPRHFAFHPTGHWLYSVQEESSTIVCFAYDPATGTLTARQTVSILPPGFMGSSFASEIRVSQDGKFLYAANRLHDTIALLAIESDGALRYRGETSTLGDYPNQFQIDPAGNFVYVCNRRSDNITCFKIHRETGALTFTGQYTAVGSPGSIVFLGNRTRKG